MTLTPTCLKRAVCAALLATGTALAWAQTAAPEPAGPLAALDARAAVPPAVYRSALNGYRPMREQPVASWRAANETVHAIGGWRAYLREAHAPEGSAPTQATTNAHDHGAPAAPSAAPASGHEGHGSPAGAAAAPAKPMSHACCEAHGTAHGQAQGKPQGKHHGQKAAPAPQAGTQPESAPRQGKAAPAKPAKPSDPAKGGGHVH